MEVKFTPAQQRVIDLHEKNILVSAAAGSGKTAVLVERIIQMVCNEEKKVDIDRLLVVTFTKAAAAEMRERISLAISKKMETDPDNAHLQRQATLIHNAQITTIDSFCLFIVRNHFDKLDIDPSFRAADEGEIEMMKQDVLKELLEEEFAAANPDFLRCVECFASGRGEEKIENMILELFKYSKSYPFPEKWLSERRKDYHIQSEEELLSTEWMKKLVELGKEKLEESIVTMEMLLKITLEPDGPYMYGDLIEQEIEMMKKAALSTNYQELEVSVPAIVMGRLPSKRDTSINVDKREKVKNLRGKVKDEIKALREQYFNRQLSMIISDMEEMAPVVNQIVHLTEAFSERFAQAKKEKNIIDFQDMEHMALKILIEPTEDGGYVESAIAREYQEYFEEIMIDEYQDSNLVQEFLLESISKEKKGLYNRFMVGDVKQSIYRFRLSMPELFMNKMGTYPKDHPGLDSNLVRIDLNQNFRSRKEVLESCNKVFEKIMCQSLGGVPYEEEVRLNVGAKYPEVAEDYSAELLLVTGKAQDAPEEEKPEKFEKKEQEAKMVAQKIQEMVGKYQVNSKEGVRPARYSDMVILMRSTNEWDEIFRKTLSDYGIPVFVPSKKGYFSTVEVNTILQLLLVLDNPRQDIPLFVALHSPIFGFTEEELALIKSTYQGEGRLLYDCLMNLSEEIEPVIVEKRERFVAFLQKYRRRAAFVSIHVLLDEILEETRYLHYVTALPGGMQRRANLEMLLEKATEFEKTSFRGLFRFVRYIEHLKEYEIDCGEAELADESADTVRIMTIHKSKGLEFPICFVSTMGKQHNTRDLSGSLLMDMRLGIAVDYFNPEKRTYDKDLRKRILASQMLEDSLGEELRVLYVAMTRAKEKLILTGSIDDFYGHMEELEGKFTLQDGHFTKQALLKGKSYLDWVLMVLSIDETFLKTSVFTPKELEAKDAKEVITESVLEASLAHRKPGDGVDEGYVDKLREIFTYEYPHKNLEKLYTKTTVSELKKAAAHDQEEDGAKPLFAPTQKPEVVPAFIEQTEELSGTERGTAVHRYMELLDFSKNYTLEELKELGAFFVLNKKMTQSQENAIQYNKIVEFLNSDVGKRMQKAEKQGKLFKEQPFVYGLPASELNEEFPKEETVLIQGIVDVFFEEDEELVVLDYKTDALKQKEDFLKRYEVQLQYYARALADITGKTVKDTIIYSFSMGKEFSTKRES